MHYDSYLRTCEIILKNYNGNLPFSVWLKDFFRQDKKYGSRDRRVISHFCYSYFRLGNAFAGLDITSRIITAIYLGSSEQSLFLERFAPRLNESITQPVAAKLELLDGEEEWRNIFPAITEISSDINAKDFSLSHLVQPDLFLRIRPGKDGTVEKKLTGENIPFRSCGDDCISLPNGVPVDTLIELDREAVVQDSSSQQITRLLQPFIKKGNTVWDCCAASGGKSIALHDQLPDIELTVSDIRNSILVNLERRFHKAGISKYRSFVADLAKNSTEEKFDVVLCDAPCTGSGTWGRTPEWLKFFKEENITRYSELQHSIVRNAIKSVKPGGFFLYATCSVFKKENEDLVEFITSSSPLGLKTMQYFKGYDQKADTLFAALFQL